jgi:acyl carrier protein
VPAHLPELTAIFREVLRDNELELEPTTRFEDLTNWDAMDLVGVVVEVECRFDVQFELFEIDRLNSVGDLLRMLTSKRALAAA